MQKQVAVIPVGAVYCGVLSKRVFSVYFMFLSFASE